ncbi:helix-turn-helix domain-containing protein [Lactobacillus psittaci]|uniref:Transcriptional regulator n=1 Tax=Lactobacillus psittaci DSM 15354 TaxID=1122152 RepID=A0A0R1SCX8_9LACO|nr:helix-turn-helix domain-containing protein [Lactobacillus psittaci]KRL63875.1 hypothetical protein FC23_GL000122 [Lactobacillus psittaci DSM 15354]
MSDIGEKLRSAREAMGLSIADVEKTTKIQSRYLTAIENSDFDKLPGDFYVRAFIRQYAQVVGLDGKELLAEYHHEVPETKSEEYVENSIDNKTEEVKKTTNSKKGMLQNYMPKIVLGAGVVIAIVVVYMLVTSLFSGSSNQADNNVDSGVTVSSQSESSSSSTKKESKHEKSTVKINRLGYGSYRVTGLKSDRKLVIYAGDNSITSYVTIDGSTEWSGSISESGKHTITIPKGTESVVVYLSSDTGTKVTIGGKKVPYTAGGSSLSLRLTLGSASASSSQNNTSSNYNNYSQNSSQTQSQVTNNQTNQSTVQSSQTTTNQTTNSGQSNTGQTTTQNNNTGNANQGGTANGQNNGGQR